MTVRETVGVAQSTLSYAAHLSFGVAIALRSWTA